GTAVADAVAVAELLFASDEQASINWDATTRAHHPSRCLMLCRRSRERDEHAAIAIRDLLALHDAADLRQELRDLGHEPVLRHDLGADAFELRTRHQFGG